MQEQHITKGDLLQGLGDLRDHIDGRLERDRDERNESIERVETRTLDRLDRIDAHLRELNGKVAKHEADNAREAQKVRSLEKEVFHGRRANLGNRAGDGAGLGEKWSAAFSRREYALMMGGVGIVGTLLKLLDFVLTKGWALLHAV